MLLIFFFFVCVTVSFVRDMQMHVLCKHYSVYTHSSLNGVSSEASPSALKAGYEMSHRFWLYERNCVQS